MVLKTCNNCPFLVRKYINGSSEFNACCGKKECPTPIGPTFMMTKCNVASAFETISSPWWCPSDDNVSDTSHLSDYTKTRQKWETMPRHIKWDSVMKGDIIHIPPIHLLKPRTIKVTSATAYNICGYEIDEKGNTINRYLSYVYPGDLAAKYMVKLKEF